MTQATPRAFERERDLEHLRRIWMEVGWLEDDETRKKGLDAYLAMCDTQVIDINGQAEVGVSRSTGTLHVQDADLETCIIAGVYTGLVARQSGHATQLTAAQVAAGVADGAVIASLGIFDQGFYERIGFGIGPYVRRMTVDPADLRVPRLTRTPERLTVDDAPAMHACRLARRRAHGSMHIHDPGATHLEVAEEPGWGFGFRDDVGALSHCMWVSHGGKIENGPWSVRFMAWNTRAQLLELLSVVKSFADQVNGVRIADPPGLQLQDLLDQPFAAMRRTNGGDYEVKPTAVAYWEHRICDLPACMAAMSMPHADLGFNLRLTDPIESYLPEDAPWRGCGGDWTIKVGDICAARAGLEAGLPVLEASVNAFTRWWMGARWADALAITDRFEAPAALLDAMNAAWHLPAPATDWDY